MATRRKVGAGRTAPAPTLEIASPTLQALQAIPGLDAAAGLHRALKREGLYIALLSRFVTGQRDFATRFTSALASGQTEEARRIVHTLKGVSGQIGAMELYAAAARLEQATQENMQPGAHTALLADTQQQLSALVSALSAALPTYSERV